MKEEDRQKDNFIYYLILIVIGIIVIYFIVGFIFVERGSLVEANERMQQTAGYFRGGSYSSGSLVMAIFVIPMIIGIIHCIRKIREK
ncbi:MAG: hypothetical protein FWC97_07260 [Treponema sp.]|nr:hypothetical protein [Treponema sp.]